MKISGIIRTVTWILALALILPACSVVQGSELNMEFYERKVQEMNGRVNAINLEAHIVRLLAAIVVLIGAAITFAKVESWKGTVTILGALVSTITLLTNLYFDGDHRDLFRRGKLCQLYVDEAEKIVIKVSATPPLIPIDTFEVLFRKHKTDFWRVAQPKLFTDISPQTLAQPLVVPVIQAGISPDKQEFPDNYLRFVGIGRSKHRNLAIERSVEQAKQNAVSFLIAQFGSLPATQRVKVDNEALATFIVSSAEILDQDYELSESRGIFRAETFILLDKYVLLDDLDYFTAKHGVELPKVYYIAIEDAQETPIEYFYRQDSVLQKTRESEKHTIGGFEIIRDTLNLRWGIAGPIGVLIDKSFFVINYNSDWKIPNWVGYYLSDSSLQGTARRTDDFREDSELPLDVRARLRDFRHSGYDRGHNAPAAAFKRTKEAMSATFLLSNVSPRTSALNRRTWRILEEQVRDLVQSEGEAWVFTGNLFLDADSQGVMPAEFIGPDSVAVPSHCFKAILSFNQDGGYSAYAFLMPNQKTRLQNGTTHYLLSVDRLEEVCGYDFFSDLEDDIENDIEAFVASDWP